MEARCQCGLTHFSIPHAKPPCLVVCHCDRCKMMSGSVYYVSVPFPHFDFPPEEAKDALLQSMIVSESGNNMIGWFCKGCGNRMAHTDGPGGRKYVSVSATKLVGLDWGLLKDKDAVMHLWTGQAVVDVPEGFKSWEGQPVFDKDV